MTQAEAARLLGVCERTFRRQINRYEEEGIDGLIDKRLSRVSHRCAPADEVMALVEHYRKRHRGWNVKHYHSWYRREEGTKNSFKGVRDVIERRGLFSSLYTDRGSHYWYTPEAGGKVDKKKLTQFGQAMKRMGIEMIPAYSPQARGRSERAFGTHQGRLPKELDRNKIRDIHFANRYLKEVYLPAYNKEFSQPTPEKGSAFVPWIGGDLDDYLCERFERAVGNDNCVSFKGMKLQIPADKYRFHYVKTKVRLLRHLNGSLFIFYGPRRLGRYDIGGCPLKRKMSVAAA